MNFSEREQLYNMILSLLVIICGTFSTVNPLLLSSDLPEDSVCPGMIVTFTCETRGSSTLAWASDEYIASDGSRLEFATFNGIGDRRASPVNPNTVATLINKTNDVLVSELRIKTLSQFFNSSVTCIVGSARNTTFVQVLVDPAMPQYINSILKNDSSGKCFIQLSWAPPNNIAVEDISAYIIRINGRDVATKMDNINRDFITDLFALYSCDSYELSIIAVDRCNRRGQSTPSFMPDPPSLIRLLTSDNDLTTQPTNESCPDPGPDTGFIIVIVLMIFFALVTAILGILLLERIVHGMRFSGNNKQSLDVDLANQADDDKKGKNYH